MVLTLGLPCLLIYLSLGYAWRVFAFVFLLLFLFFPLPSDQIGGGFLVCYFFSSLSLLLFVFFGCSDGMEREACVCDHGFERSDLCAEIIIIIIIIVLPVIIRNKTYTRNGQIVLHVRRTEKKQKRPCPAVQGTWLHVGSFLAGVLTQRFSTQPLELYIPRLSRCTAQ